MSGANITVAKYCAELKIADAVPRSAVGNHAATIRGLPGNEGDSARPMRKRSENSATAGAIKLIHPTNPCNAVNADHTSRLKAYTFFEPEGSSRHPPGS